MPKSFHTDAYGAFVEQLIAARKRAGMTQAELAKCLGRPQSFVSHFEHRIRRLDIIETLIIARMLGLDPSTMIMDLNSLVAGITQI